MNIQRKPCALHTRVSANERLRLCFLRRFRASEQRRSTKGAAAFKGKKKTPVMGKFVGHAVIKGLCVL